MNALSAVDDSGTICRDVIGRLSISDRSELICASRRVMSGIDPGRCDRYVDKSPCTPSGIVTSYIVNRSTVPDSALVPEK